MLSTITASGANSRIKLAIAAKDSKNYIVIPRQSDGQLISGAYNRAWKEDRVVGTIAEASTIKIAQKNGFENLPIFIIEKEKYYIRVITEREAFRLMGFTDHDFEKAKKVASKNQLYRTAGNSIVVQVLEAIFKELFLKED